MHADPVKPKRAEQSFMVVGMRPRVFNSEALQHELQLTDTKDQLMCRTLSSGVAKPGTWH